MAAAGVRQAMAPCGGVSMKADVCGSRHMARRSSALYSMVGDLQSTLGAEADYRKKPESRPPRRDLFARDLARCYETARPPYTDNIKKPINPSQVK